jgi:hypothetical protein
MEEKMNVQTHVANGSISHSRSAGVGMHDAIELCLRTHQECMETFQYCLQRGGEHSDPHHLKLMQTCVEITYSAARFMMLQSSYHHMICEICAQICQACAKSCESLRDDAMLDCSKLCLACADSCQIMAGAKF